MKCYIGIISTRLRIILYLLIYTYKYFWRRFRGNGCWVNFEPSLSLYHYFFFPFPFYHGSRIHPYLPIWCTHRHKPTAIRIFKAHPKPYLWATPQLINMVQDQPFLGKGDENPYSHLNEFEKTCACLHITGMLDETLRWKLFSFSLIGKAKRWYKKTIGSRQGVWEALCSSLCLYFFPISRVVSLCS